MNRRQVLKGLTVLPLVSAVKGVASEMPDSSATSSRAGKSIYSGLGVRPVINARSTVTIVGATQILPEVQQAMDAAVREFVQLDELMDKVGERLAELTGAEYGFVTAGASAAITAGTAGCVTGGDPDKAWRIPDLYGMKDEVIIPAYSRSAYDAAAKAVGVRMVEVSSLEELRHSIGPRTAMILIAASSRSEEGPLSLTQIASVAQPLKVPILVDAAAEGLEVPNPHLSQGADLVAYSGGKYLRGPQCAGLLLGRKDLILASRITTAPHHGFGRGFKVGREEIIGMLTAVEMWFKRDHAAEWKEWTSRIKFMEKKLARIDGVRTEMVEPTGRSNKVPSLKIEWDLDQIPYTGYDVEQLLWEGTPRIAVSGAGSYLPFPPNLQPNIRVYPSSLRDGDERLIAERLLEIFQNPVPKERAAGTTDHQIGGQWLLEMNFAASSVNQSLVFEQQGSLLKGIHSSLVGERELSGHLNGNTILFRSSYTREGTRINYEFSGQLSGDTMSGAVNMGEYGMASWKATRRKYRS